MSTGERTGKVEPKTGYAHEQSRSPTRPIGRTAKGLPPLVAAEDKGRHQVRPFLCKGPVMKDREFTLLFGAFEKTGNTFRRMLGT